MAGPTPVSALIHAATMVTAGVYLVARVNPVIASAYDWAPSIIAWVGAFTALFAATIAVAQNDIKKVLAYSTVSQLGYMFLAVGTGAYVAAIFHLITHAFFKALLFLGSGSVIHGDARRAGHATNGRPAQAHAHHRGTFIVGWLAIAGVPPFAGFFSKDEILLFAYGSGGSRATLLYALGLVTALLTAYLHEPAGLPRLLRRRALPRAGRVDADADESTEDAADEHHDESSRTRVALDDDGAADGARRTRVRRRRAQPHLHSTFKFLEKWLRAGASRPTRPSSTWRPRPSAAWQSSPCFAVVGIVYAYRVFVQKRSKAVEPEVLAHGWYYDEAISAFVDKPGREAFQATADFDAGVVDGAVDGVGSVVAVAGRHARKLQSGFVRAYAAGHRRRCRAPPRLLPATGRPSR